MSFPDATKKCRGDDEVISDYQACCQPFTSENIHAKLLLPVRYDGATRSTTHPHATVVVRTLRVLEASNLAISRGKVFSIGVESQGLFEISANLISR